MSFVNNKKAIELKLIIKLQQNYSIFYWITEHDLIAGSGFVLYLNDFQGQKYYVLPKIGLLHWSIEHSTYHTTTFHLLHS